LTSDGKNTYTYSGVKRSKYYYCFTYCRDQLKWSKRDQKWFKKSKNDN